MYKEDLAGSEVHTSHCMSKRFRIAREERIWHTTDDLLLTSKIDIRNNIVKGVQ
jgi:hypothetical protein